MAEDSPVVSVVIIFLDPGAEFLREAIASVQGQTFRDWELLLVDDGSTDDSTALARALAAAEPARIRYLEHPGHANRGMSASRNRGIEAARGRYLAFLDADDVYLPERLEHHVDILERHREVALVFGRHELWFSWQAGTNALDRTLELGFEPERVFEPPIVLLTLLRTSGRYNPGICTQTVRREAALAVGGFEAEFRGSHEDQVFMAKIFSRYPAFVTDRVDSRYRQHAGSHTAISAQPVSAIEGHPNTVRERYFRWLRDYLESEGLMQPALRRILILKLLPFEHRFLYAVIGMPLITMARRVGQLKRELSHRLGHFRQLATFSSRS